MIGVVLAAGRGRRIGGPKGLLVLNGVPLALAQATRMLEAGASEVVVAATEEIAERITWPARVRAIVSHASDPAGSLAVALRAVKLQDDVVAVTPVDLLPACTTTFALLFEAMGDSSVNAATPTHEGRSGHPVLVRRAALDAHERGKAAPPTLHETLKKMGDRRVRVAVTDPAVVAEIDTAQDAERHLGATLFYMRAGSASPFFASKSLGVETVSNGTSVGTVTAPGSAGCSSTGSG